MSMESKFLDDTFRITQDYEYGSEKHQNTGRTLALSIDLKDAFCRISKHRIVKKFLDLGGSPVYANFLLKWLTDRTVQSRLGDWTSRKCCAGGLGVDQGSVLGGFCFMLSSSGSFSGYFVTTSPRRPLSIRLPVNCSLSFFPVNNIASAILGAWP